MIILQPKQTHQNIKEYNPFGVKYKGINHFYNNISLSGFFLTNPVGDAERCDACRNEPAELDDIFIEDLKFKNLKP